MAFLVSHSQEWPGEVSVVENAQSSQSGFETRASSPAGSQGCRPRPPLSGPPMAPVVPTLQKRGRRPPGPWFGRDW